MGNSGGRFLSDAEWEARGGIPQDPPKHQHVVVVSDASIEDKQVEKVTWYQVLWYQMDLKWAINKLVCRVFGHTWTYYPYEGTRCLRCKAEGEDDG